MPLIGPAPGWGAGRRDLRARGTRGPHPGGKHRYVDVGSAKLEASFLKGEMARSG
jgi:hypothetical protein